MCSRVSSRLGVAEIAERFLGLGLRVTSIELFLRVLYPIGENTQYHIPVFEAANFLNPKPQTPKP